MINLKVVMALLVAYGLEDEIAAKNICEFLNYKDLPDNFQEVLIDVKRAKKIYGGA